jgi:AcrR family transcriptional regulator
MSKEPIGTAPSVLSPAQRRQRNRQEMIQAILEAARAVMRGDSVAALNLHEVARRVQLRTPSLYTYFAGKMALYDALYQLGLRLYTERSQQLDQLPASYWERYRAALVNYMAFAQEYPELYQLVFEHPVPGFVPSEQSQEVGRKLLAHTDDILRRAIASGAIAPAIPLNQARDLSLAMQHGLAALHLANDPDLPIGSGRFGSLIDAVIELFQRSWDGREAPGDAPD